ncbi:hypothetical protein ACSSS7_001919 [Eimeria intestinalis]
MFAAANLAASWLLASGVEAEIRFAHPVVPTPVVFIGASRPIEGLPRFTVSQVTSESFKVQLFGGLCGASPELKLVTSYLALPPGEYLAKHSSLRLVVGRTLVTSLGDTTVKLPFVLSEPSKWQEDLDQSWTPSIWGSKCSFKKNLLIKLAEPEVKFTGLYIAATAQLSQPPSEDQPVEGESDQTDVEDVLEETMTDVKCKVFDMRNYASNLAWDSLTFTCACPGQSPACSQTAAARDLTWLKQLHEEGGLCEVASGAIKPVVQQFYQLNQDACSLAYVQDPSLLPWSKRAYPAYPDFSGPGSETAADEGEDTGVVAPQGPVVPPSCFAGEWGEWSVCDATCLSIDQNPQRLRRRSPLVSVDSVDSSTCALEEKESCADTLELCSSYCWSAPWTEWAECAELLVANKLVNARRRYRPIFAGAELCDLEEIQELDICQGADFRRLFRSAEPLCCPLSLLALGKCVAMEGGSFLDCRDRGGLLFLYFALVVMVCMARGVVKLFSSYRRACALFGRPWRTSCRPTFTRVVNLNVTYSFLTKVSEDEDTAGVLADPSSSVPSCSCLEDGLEPCTAEDVVEDWKGIRDTLLGSGGLCTTKAAQIPLWSLNENNKMPDSSIFFGYAGFGRLHCPLRGYKKLLTGVEEYFTFTKFSSSAELNDFCEEGLNYWDDAANPLVRTSLGVDFPCQ